MDDHVSRRLLRSPTLISTDKAISRETAASRQAAAVWFAALLQAETHNADGTHANLLGWLLVLPEGLDPATAATDVLTYQAHHPQPALSSTLTALLRAVAAAPLVSLPRRSSRRRGGLH